MKDETVGNCYIYWFLYPTLLCPVSCYGLFDRLLIYREITRTKILFGTLLDPGAPNKQVPALSSLRLHSQHFKQLTSRQMKTALRAKTRYSTYAIQVHRYSKPAGCTTFQSRSARSFIVHDRRMNSLGCSNDSQFGNFENCLAVPVASPYWRTVASDASVNDTVFNAVSWYALRHTQQTECLTEAR